MAVKDRTTKMANFSTSVREIDFVTRFGANWEALQNILGISRPIRKAPGTKLTVTEAEITLQSGNVSEGDEIPYSLASVADREIGDVTFEKYAKGVSIESVAKYGARKAVQMTDDALLNKLQKNICDKFYTFLKTGTLTYTATTWQMAMAMAKGNVLNMWSAMDKDITEVVAFVNVLDFYAYVGAAEISIQTAFGMQYVKDFMGYNTVFLLDSNRVPRNKVLATPVENIVVYYADPSDSDFAELGLEYTVAGETPFVGFHAEGNYSHAVGETYAIMAMFLFAEYLNGISVVTVEASGSLGTVTVASAAGTATGDSAVTVTYTLGAGETAYMKDATAAAEPAYLTDFDPTGWTKLTFTSGTAQNMEGLTSGNNLTVIVVNGAGQVVAGGHATIVVK